MLGLQIRGLQWGDRTAPNKALCVHGYMDNAMSFAALAPLLLDDGRRLHIVAIDLPGHGLSDHFPPYVAYRPEVFHPSPRIHPSRNRLSHCRIKCVTVSAIAHPPHR